MKEWEGTKHPWSGGMGENTPFSINSLSGWNGTERGRWGMNLIIWYWSLIYTPLHKKGHERNWKEVNGDYYLFKKNVFCTGIWIFCVSTSTLIIFTTNWIFYFVLNLKIMNWLILPLQFSQRAWINFFWWFWNGESY